MSGASPTAVGRASHINDPVWTSQWCCGFDESFPIIAGPWCKNLGTQRATVLLRRLVNIQTTLALDENTRRVLACERDLLAHAPPWTPWFWLQGDSRQLTIIRFAVIVAIAIVPCNTVFILRCLPQVQIAIRFPHTHP